jgi:hypothetical protein
LYLEGLIERNYLPSASSLCPFPFPFLGEEPYYRHVRINEGVDSACGQISIRFDW